MTTCVRIDNDLTTTLRSFRYGQPDQRRPELVVDGDPDVFKPGPAVQRYSFNIPKALISPARTCSSLSMKTPTTTPVPFTIYGQASDNASAFSTRDFSISSLPRANASVSWTPSDWLAVGDAGFISNRPISPPSFRKSSAAPDFPPTARSHFLSKV